MHDFEVFIQDSIAEDFPQAKNVQINPKFVLKGDYTPSPYKGSCSLRGTTANHERAPANALYHDIALRDGPIMLSKNSFSMTIGDPNELNDFYQYNALKNAVICGGVNRLEGSYHGRNQRGERVIGAALHTLIQKYGFSRDEFFLVSRQGYSGIDAIDGVPDELTIEELAVKYPNIRGEYMKDLGYCFHPLFLHHCLDHSLKRFNVETLDCVLL